MKRESAGRVRLDPARFEAHLSAAAARSTESRGRERAEEVCGLRTPYQRDRDRIVHSKAFRRLKHKTQVFISPDGDHYRTRLTHVLEVSGIARAVARGLALNEDLTEAVALGHDLGHTPFGHAGEEALGEVLRRHGLPGFSHNEQSLRVVEAVENDGRGLNLTWEVRDGIRRHTGAERPGTLEARIVRICDRVAYINHDIDDALRAGIITAADLPRDPIAVLGRTGSDRIDRLVHDLVDESDERGDIGQSDKVARAMGELRDFLFDTVYRRSITIDETSLIRSALGTLFDHYLAHPEELPDFLEAHARSDSDSACSGGMPSPAALCAVTDYVAGMTDRYALRAFEELTGRGLRIGQLRLPGEL